MRFSVNSSLAKRIRDQGRCKRSGPVTVRYIADEFFRFSPIVSKKQGTAPERNRVKRIVRELMRAGEGTFPNGSYLITLYGPCEALNQGELKSAVHAIMSSIEAGPHSELQENDACT